MPFLKLSNTLFNHEGEVATDKNVYSTRPEDDSALVDCDEESTQFLKPCDADQNPHGHRRRASSMVGGGVPLDLRPVVSTNGSAE